MLALLLFLFDPFVIGGFLNDREVHEAGGFMMFSLLLYAWLWMAFSPIVPGLIHGDVGTLRLMAEFLWTRAIDRRLLHRAGTATNAIIFLGPLVLNLLVSPLASKLSIEIPDTLSPENAAMRERYLAVFPGSEVTNPAGAEAERLILHRGTQMLAAWLLWLGVVCSVVVYGYWALVLKRIQRLAVHIRHTLLRGVIVELIVYVPMFLIPLAPAAPRLLRGINLYEESFLYFASHPVPFVTGTLVVVFVMQLFVEKRFSQLELP
jgi:hypothetical protein